MTIAVTERLRLRALDERDAAFMLALLNDPSWIRYIGDKGVRTLEAARRHIVDGPVAMYAQRGFGLYLVERKDTTEPIGLCGLIKRDALDDVDLGFAFLPEHRRSGYALESAVAVMAYAKDVVKLSRVVAIVSHDNDRSRKLLDKLGFRYERTVRVAPEGDDLALYAAAL